MSINQSALNESALLEPQLRGVIFDMDGVLVDSHAVHRKAWRLFLHTLGREVPESDLDFILDGRKRSDILRHFLGDCPEHQMEEFGRRKDSIYRQIQLSVVPVPGVVRLVRELNGSGIALAVATCASASRAHATLLDLGLVNCFETVVTGEDVPNGKPDPGVYLVACDRLKIERKHLLAVEDAVSGIRAAVGAGLSCLAVALHEAPEALRRAGAIQVVPDFERVSPPDLEYMFSGCDTVSSRAGVPGHR
jgi:beta-phosphoglucomutase